jgi:CHAT domain-containing protein
LLEFVKYRRLASQPARDAAHRFADAEYAAYVLPATGAPSAYRLGDARKVDALVLSLRSALTRRGAAWKRKSRALYDGLVRPLRDKLATGAPLFVAPDSTLNLVPFAVLLDEHEQSLLAAHPIVYLSSGRDRLRVSGLGDANAPRSPPLVLAAPDYDAFSGGRAARSGLLRNVQFPALPGTLLEARSLAASFGAARVLSGREASEPALRAAHSPEFLHVAAHAFFFDVVPSPGPRATRGIELSGSAGPEFGADIGDEGAGAPLLSMDPLLRAGVALAGANRGGATPSEDGVVTALEVASLDLTRTELVTLSACDTALGEIHDGEGVFGLRRALVLAGSRSQLLSLWRVADQPTQVLMTDYYRRLALGEERGAALRAVQLDFASQPGRTHPYYWAAFVLSGDEQPLPRGSGSGLGGAMIEGQEL